MLLLLLLLLLMVKVVMMNSNTARSPAELSCLYTGGPASHLYTLLGQIYYATVTFAARRYLMAL